MMKKHFLAVFLLWFLLPCYAQEKYTEVVSVDSLTADQLFSRAKLYIANSFVSAKDVTELSDDQGKTIVAKGNFKVRPHGLGSAQSFVKFKLTIANKDRRYRYSFTDIVFVYQAGSVTRVFETGINEIEAGGVTKKQWSNVRDQVNETIDKMIADLKKQMGVNDNW